jgi:hypothetical protein
LIMDCTFCRWFARIYARRLKSRKIMTVRTRYSWDDCQTFRWGNVDQIPIEDRSRMPDFCARSLKIITLFDKRIDMLSGMRPYLDNYCQKRQFCWRCEHPNHRINIICR